MSETNREMDVVATWSGGIDSTAVIGHLLKRGYNVLGVTLRFSMDGPKSISEVGSASWNRESRARAKLSSYFSDTPGSLDTVVHDGSWLWQFSSDDKEIPRRNKRIMDYIIAKEMIPAGITNIAMGEYTGADTWVVRDHVPMIDCDHRSLSAYLYLEYGMSYRLISLQDFGESRYKADRLRLGIEAIGEEAMGHTVCCLAPRIDLIHCGECYKCAERYAAWRTLDLRDPTEYANNPAGHPKYPEYMMQMAPCLERKK